MSQRRFTVSFKTPDFNQPLNLDWSLVYGRRPREMQEVLNAIYGIAKHRVGTGFGVSNSIYGLMVGDELARMLDSEEVPKEWHTLILRDLAAKEGAKYQKMQTGKQRKATKVEYQRGLNANIRNTEMAIGVMESQARHLRNTEQKLGNRVDSLAGEVRTLESLRDQIMNMLVNVPGQPPKPACEMSIAELVQWRKDNRTNVDAGEENIKVADWHIERIEAEKQGLPEPALPDLRDVQFG